MCNLDFLLESCAYKYSLSCVLNQTGLSKRVEWVYLAEDIENMSFIKNGELVITTGYFITGGTTLYDFISALIKRGTAGVILNVGKYITADDITDEIKQLCKNNDFALLTMPWSVHISDVMQELCALLINDREKNGSLTNAFERLIGNPQQRDRYFDTLVNNGFYEDCYYTVILADGNIENEVGRLNAKCHIMEYAGGNMAVICSKNCPTVFNVFEVSAGISSTDKGFFNLGGLVKQAQTALKAVYVTGESMVLYDNIGALGIILAVEDEFLLKSFFQNRLSRIAEYDKKHNSELVETLFYYLKTGCSPAETAKLMCAHRNTVTYRINKIRELTGKTFDTVDEQQEYLTAIYIQRYFTRA
jgi:hypothetical protein